MNTHYIGIIVSSLFYKRIEKGKKQDELSFYEEAGRINQLIPCFFRFEDLLIGENYLLALVKNESGEYMKISIPRPRVIHNRSYQWSNTAKQKIHSLIQEGIVIFNDWNRYGKFEIHELLRKNEKVKPHLPETVFFNKENFSKMMAKYPELIIKPNTGSLGKRNMKVERKNHSEWDLYYPEEEVWKEEHFSSDKWPAVLNTKMSKFIIQERIPLAEFEGCPFDIRVSVQKNGTGSWQITGMVGKVAKKGRFVTNVARGGTCYTLKEILKHIPHLNDQQVYKDIETLSLLVAQQLEKDLPNLADIGLDIGITEYGFPMFIECNARELRYAFRNANMFENWKATYTTPISYGKYLLNLQKEFTNQIRND